MEKLAQWMLTKLNPLFDWSSVTSLDLLWISLVTLRSASSLNTTKGAAVVVVEEVRRHSSIRFSAAIGSRRRWVDSNMVRWDEARTSAQMKMSHEIEVSWNGVEKEVKPEPGKWEEEYQRIQGQQGGEDIGCQR